MSDPAKTPEEIEDVLASIRRLVSDHGPASERMLRPVAERAKAAPPVTGALVLTPSFRVADPGDPWAPIAAHDEIDQDDETPADAGAALAAVSQRPSRAPDQPAEWTPTDRLARFDVVGRAAALPAETDDLTVFDDLDVAVEAVLGAGLVEDHPTGNDLAEDHLAEETLAEADLADLIRLDGAGEVAGEFESETGDENWPGDGADAALLTLVARRDPMPVDHAKDATDAPTFDDFSLIEPAIPPTHPQPEGLATSDPEDTDPPERMDSLIEALSPADDAEGNAVDMAASDPADAPGDNPVLSEADDDVDPHLDANGDLDGDTGAASADDDGVTPIFSRRSRVEAAEDAAAFDVDDLGADPSPFSFPDPEDGILDEDTLREIIVDVVREELQGVLGQRITRNVRKMVRREIRLALAAEDLD